ncbi:MAG: hypothetical protein EOP45_01730 [Sphingobacteriaceae bacterium]|nr:MAG: hypothetical protein EOP45_01730 [Sphingobacteriaceae bacterium]
MASKYDNKDDFLKFLFMSSRSGRDIAFEGLSTYLKYKPDKELFLKRKFSKAIKLPLVSQNQYTLFKANEGWVSISFILTLKFETLLKL